MFRSFHIILTVGVILIVVLFGCLSLIWINSGSDCPELEWPALALDEKTENCGIEQKISSDLTIYHVSPNKSSDKAPKK